jgi:alpha-beta hydrolase superfamily lysophospholipase
MRELTGRLSPLAAACLAFLLAPAASRAANPVDVKFNTFDRVQLHGSFYPAQGGAKSPCVILVHRLGGSRQQAGWEDLAKALQKQDYAVLSFDLRGHGDSVDVDPATFWMVPSNLQYIRGAIQRKSKISHKDFSRDYTPMLANDVAAAKIFLDDQNNLKLCNSSNTMVVGEEDGAAIAALWITSQWLRPPVAQRDVFGRVVAAPTLEGSQICAAAWLSMPATLNRVSLAPWFRASIPGSAYGTRTTIGDKVPMAFYYAKGDSSAASAARTLLSALSPGRGKQSLSVAKAKEGKAAGIDLVAKEAVKPDEDIAAFLSSALEKRTAGEWAHKDSTQPQPIALSTFGYGYLR